MPSNKPWSGNKGEWGEAFVLLHLLAHETLFNGDSDLNRIETEFSEVKAIYRREASGAELVFKINTDTNSVEVINDGTAKMIIPQSSFSEKAHSLFEGIQQNKKEFSEEDFLKELGCENLKASSTNKADLIARVVDGLLSTEAQRHYSIKTLIGGKPTLGNVSSHTFFQFELQGASADSVAEVMNISEKENAWVQKRVRKCHEICDKVLFYDVPSDTYKRNLLECHWHCPEVAAYALLASYFVPGKRFPDVIKRLVDTDPAGFAAQNEDIRYYEMSLRKLLWAITFGMVPSKRWYDFDTVDGYLIAKSDEQVLSYQVSRRSSFENYLLNHSSFDTPDNRRSNAKPHALNKNCTIEEIDGKFYLWLNLQIRFEPKRYAGNNPLADPIFYESISF